MNAVPQLSAIDYSCFDNIAPYDTDACLQHLGLVRELIPDALVLRTDRLSAGDISETNGQRIFIELPGEKFRVGVFPNYENRPFGYLTKKFGITAKNAFNLQRAMFMLARMSPLSAWPLQTSQISPFAFSQFLCKGEPILADSYLAETCEILAEDLPAVSSIDIDYLITGKPNSRAGTRRRAFIRFNGSGRKQLLSIDSAGMPIHARKQILQKLDDGEADDGMFRLNLFRMERWASALGTTPDNLAEVFPTLIFLTSSLHVTRIDLRED